MKNSFVGKSVNMVKEKFNIKIERNLLRLNAKGNKTTSKYPKNFGDKEKNNFITTEKQDYILKIKTPISDSISEVYDKLQEITDVVYAELYDLNEIICPFSNFADIDLNSKVSLSINKEYYEEIRKVNKNLPAKLEEAYKNVKEQFNSKSDLVEKVFGKCALKTNKIGIEVSLH